MNSYIKPVEFGRYKPNLIWYNIYNENKIQVGYIGLEFNFDGSIVYLEEIYISEEYRGAGIGTEIINEIIEFIKNLGSSKLWLFVAFNNEKAQKLYKKLGFRFLNHNSEYCYKMEYCYE